MPEVFIGKTWAKQYLHILVFIVLLSLLGCHIGGICQTGAGECNHERVWAKSSQASIRQLLALTLRNNAACLLVSHVLMRPQICRFNCSLSINGFWLRCSSALSQNRTLDDFWIRSKQFWSLCETDFFFFCWLSPHTLKLTVSQPPGWEEVDFPSDDNKAVTVLTVLVQRAAHIWNSKPDDMLSFAGNSYLSEIWAGRRQSEAFEVLSAGWSHLGRF